MALPEPVSAWLARHSLRARSAAYLQIDGAGRIASAGGALERYGLAVAPGAAADVAVPLLIGMRESPPADIPCVETAPGIYADVHVFAAGASVWVLFADVTPEAEARRALQQREHDRNLGRRPK